MASSSCLSERASAFDEAADSTFGAQRGAAHRMQPEEVSTHRVHSEEGSAHRMQADMSTHQIHSDEVAVHRMESEDGIQDRRRLRGVSEVVMEVANIREQVPVSEMVELRLVGVWRARAAVDVVSFQ